jgi:hypothetical protein
MSHRASGQSGLPPSCRGVPLGRVMSGPMGYTQACTSHPGQQSEATFPYKLAPLDNLIDNTVPFFSQTVRLSQLGS